MTEPEPDLLEPDVIPVEFQLTRVDVYARGALLTYEVTIPEDLPGAATTLVLTPLDPSIEPASVRTTQDGGRTIRSVFVKHTTNLSPQPPQERQDQLNQLLRKQTHLEQSIETFGRLASHLVHSTPTPTFYVPDDEKEARDPTALIQDAFAARDLVVSGYQSLHDLQAKHEEERRSLRKKIEALQVEIDQYTAQAASSQASIHIVLADGELPLKRLNVACVIPAARWWPAYTIRLDSQENTAHIGLDAWVAQRSGVNWESVALSFSTARLSSDARLPKLSSLRYGRQQPPEQGITGFRPPPQGLGALFSGYDKAYRSLQSPPPSPPSTGSVPIPTHAPAQAPKEEELAFLDDDYMDDAGEGLAYAPMPQTASLVPESKSSGLVSNFARSFLAPSKDQYAQTREQSMRRKAVGRVQPKIVAAQAEMDRRVSGEQSRGHKKRDAMRFEESVSLGGFADELSDDVAFDEPLNPPSSGIQNAWLHFDSLILHGIEAPVHQRGTLGLPEDNHNGLSSHRIRAVESQQGPVFGSDPDQERGFFDHMFRADGVGNIPSDDALHRIKMTSRRAPSKTRWRCVASEDTAVYREILFKNPFHAPLLSGPADILVDGTMVAQERFERVDRGGEVAFGLGEEHNVRVVRNVRVREHSEGLFKGTVSVVHHIDIEVRSWLNTEIELELIDRVPHTDDDDIEIEVHSAQPTPKTYTQHERGHKIRGGLLWKLNVPPNATTRIQWSYTIKLPAKYELGGGNRRD